MKKLILILLMSQSALAEKPVLYGRKDLIRNEIIINNNELCKYAINAITIQNKSLDKQLFILLDENKELTRQLKECQNSGNNRNNYSD